MKDTVNEWHMHVLRSVLQLAKWTNDIGVEVVNVFIETSFPTIPHNFNFLEAIMINKIEE